MDWLICGVINVLPFIIWFIFYELTVRRFCSGVYIVLDTVGSDTTHVPGSGAAPQRDRGSDPERPQPGAAGSHQTHRR